MKKTIALVLAVGAAVAGVATEAVTAKAHNAATHATMKGGCKGEFMYMKGGKCMDARNKAT